MIGRLRHRLTLEAPTRMTDSAGGARQTWREIGKLWAALRDLSGGEKEYAEAESAAKKVEVIIRFREDITPDMRFIYGARMFNISAILDQRGTKRFLTCICEEAL